MHSQRHILSYLPFLPAVASLQALPSPTAEEDTCIYSSSRRPTVEASKKHKLFIFWRRTCLAHSGVFEINAHFKKYHSCCRTPAPQFQCCWSWLSVFCFLTLGAYFTGASTHSWTHPVNIEKEGTGVSSDVWVYGWAFISKTPVLMNRVLLVTDTCNCRLCLK